MTCPRDCPYSRFETAYSRWEPVILFLVCLLVGVLCFLSWPFMEWWHLLFFVVLGVQTVAIIMVSRRSYADGAASVRASNECLLRKARRDDDAQKGH